MAPCHFHLLRLLLLHQGDLSVGLPQPLAHGGPDAGPGLGEEGAPALDRPCSTEGLDAVGEGGPG